MNLETKIKEIFLDILKSSNPDAKIDFHDNLILLESGLDSLGFAILVARLEEELGYDPFTIMETPVYPTVFSEFVNIYESNKPNT